MKISIELFAGRLLYGINTDFAGPCLSVLSVLVGVEKKLKKIRFLMGLTKQPVWCYNTGFDNNRRLI